MSPEAFVADSDPSHRCPDCGADLRPDAERCWLCHRSLVIEAELVESSRESPFAPAWVHGAHKSGNPWQFSLESLLLVITLVAVCLGMIMATPGLGILASMVAAPALIRTLMAGHQARGAGKPMTLAEKVMAFLASTGIAIAVVSSGVIAFGAACFASCLVALGVEQSARQSGLGALDEYVIWIALIFSAVVGLGTAAWIFWILRPAKPRPPTVRKGG